MSKKSKIGWWMTSGLIAVALLLSFPLLSLAAEKKEAPFQRSGWLEATKTPTTAIGKPIYGGQLNLGSGVTGGFVYTAACDSAGTVWSITPSGALDDKYLPKS